MNKTIHTAAIAAAIIGASMTSCTPDNDAEQPAIVTCPASEVPSLFCNGIGKSATATDSHNVIFTDNDIVYFDPATREIKFYGEMDSLYKKVPLLTGVEFILGGEPLFEGSCTLVGLICSQVFTDIVLCYGAIYDGAAVDGYYLLDCYPPELAGSDEARANRERHAGEWARLIEYLDGKGKIKK